MKIAFTVCSNNYLSQAKALGDSLKKYSPEYTFFIGLCDRRSKQIDYDYYAPAEILEVEKLEIPNFKWMTDNYNIIELNTSVKPYYFQYFLNNYPDAEIVIYFDPDIKVFDNLGSIEEELAGKSILLTPHILSPIADDGKVPDEAIFLNYGVYNLGFLAVCPTPETMKMLKWWSNKLATQCFDRTEKGIFVDQLPMTYVPVFYEDVQVSKNPGYNFAYWNFHERTISERDGKYYINEKYPLVFFHFSNFKPVYPIHITSKQNRFSLDKLPVLKHLFSEYAEILLLNKYNELIKIPNYYSFIYIQEIVKKKSFFSKMKKKNKDKKKIADEGISHYY